MKLFAFALLCSSLCAQQPDVERAWDLAAKGAREQAIQLLKQTITRYPANPDARLLLGSLLSEAGNAPEAIEQLAAAVHLNPTSADAQNALGEAYLAANDYKDARTPLEAAVRLNPRSGAAQMNLGSVLLKLTDYQAAGQHLDSAIRLLGNDPDAAYACYLRSRVYYAASDSANEARLLQKAIAIRPAYPEAWSDLGQTRKLLLDEQGALSAFNRAVQINPRDAVAQYRLGSQYLRMEQLTPALDHLEAAYHLDPSDQSILNALQSALRQAGKADEADEVRGKLADLLHEKDRQNQDYIKAVELNNEGAALQKAGNIAGALEKYRQAATMLPSHEGIQVNYAVALLRSGEWTEGLTRLHEALAHDPGNAQIRSALNDALRQAPRSALPAWANQ